MDPYAAQALEPVSASRAAPRPLSLLKTVNYRESLEIFQHDRRAVGTRDLIRRMSLADHHGALRNPASK